MERNVFVFYFVYLRSYTPTHQRSLNDCNVARTEIECNATVFFYSITWNLSIYVFERFVFSFLLVDYTTVIRIIVDKIDEDKDGFVDIYELKTWISYTQRRYIDEDVNRQWKQHNPDNEDKLSWQVSEI